MGNPLTRKLQLFASLDEDDRRVLDGIIRSPRQVGPHEDIAVEGEPIRDVHLIIEGFACRYKILTDGSRQIMAYLVPGDFCDLHVFILNEMDHSIATLSPCTIVDIPRADILALTERPEIARALWWATLVDEATLREWLVNIGQREATERIGHLLCEIHLRLESVGLTNGAQFELPITQAELADTMGMSAVHANRALQNLRSQGLITLKRRQLVLLDPARLKEMSGFNPNYLHLTGGKRDRSARPGR